MTVPTVNTQITDSVTQVNVQVLGNSASVAMGNLYQATSLSLANAAHNATTTQQLANVTSQAVTTQGVASILTLSRASIGCHKDTK